METLPKDIIADILSRLMVKHLLKCKCVSHAWYNLISDRSFVKLHRDQSRRVGSKQRVVYSRYPNSLHTADFDSFEGETGLGHPPSYPHSENAVVVGSCDGLLCLCELGRCNTRFVLYNPTTRFYNIIPWSPFEGNVGSDYMLYFGFGYDSTIDDYKVLRIAQTSEDPGDYFRCDARVYSLSTNTWKKVSDVPYCLYRLHMFGVLLNGALHFLASEIPEQSMPDKVVAFNLEDESYYSVPQPKFRQWPEHEEKRRWLTIGVLDGCLSLIDNFCHEDLHYGVWIMKEYGVQKSWCKVYRIAYPEPIPMINTGGPGEPIPAGLRPISFSKNRRELFFMVLFSYLVSYDLEKKTLHQVVHPNDQVVTWDMLLYEETLTSPLTGSGNGDGDEEILDLPEDIMTNILLRLPVNSLVRFKSVSWLWYDLINDPSFVACHVERSRKTSSKLHIVYHNTSFTLRHAEFDSFDGDTRLDHPFIGPNHSTIVVGASEGLLCLCDISMNNLTFPFALYNPTTRSSNVLPGAFLDGFSMDYDHVLGFGYDPARDDYKVVKIAQLQPNKNDSLRDHAQVYSLNTNSWKWVTTSPYRLSGLLHSGVCVNGVMHWVASSDSNNRFLFDAIAGFDLVTENYFLVPQPGSLEPLLGRRCTLDIGILDGCLSQVCNFLDQHFHDVWIMREYGVQSSWSKLFRIVDEEPFPIILRPKYFSTNKRELFFMALVGNIFVSYNVEENKLRKCPYSTSLCWDIHIYEETLVSTDAGNGDWEEQDYQE